MRVDSLIYFFLTSITWTFNESGRTFTETNVLRSASILTSSFGKIYFTFTRMGNSTVATPEEVVAADV